MRDHLALAGMAGAALMLLALFVAFVLWGGWRSGGLLTLVFVAIGAVTWISVQDVRTIAEVQADEDREENARMRHSAMMADCDGDSSYIGCHPSLPPSWSASHPRWSGSH